MAEDYSILDLKVEPDTKDFYELNEENIHEKIDEAIDSIPLRNISTDQMRITESYIRFSLIASNPSDGVYDEQYGLMGKIIRIIQEETSTNSVEVEVRKTGAS